MLNRIPVVFESRIVDFVDSYKAKKFVGATNAEVVRRRKTGEIVRINIREHGTELYKDNPRYGNPQKYTFVELLGDPTTYHCHTLKHIPRSAWPIFRSALVDCLPSQKQEQIRQIFKRPTDRVAARAHGQPQQAG